MNVLYESLLENFKTSTIICIKDMSLENFYALMKCFDMWVIDKKESTDKIRDFFGDDAAADYQSFYDRSTYDQYPGILKVTCKKTEDGKPCGIVPIKEQLNYHRDATAFRYPYHVLALHGERANGSVTNVIDTIAPYEKLTAEDKTFCDSLVYEYRNDQLKEIIAREQKKKKRVIAGKTRDSRQNEASDYPNLTNYDIFINYTDDHYHTVEKSLVQTSITGKKGFAFEFSGLVPFKGKTLRESVKISRWLESIIVKDEYKYRHEWEDGDVLMFDSVCTIHARDPYEDEDRLVHRVLFNI